MLKRTEPILVAYRFPALLETLLDLLTTLSEAEWQVPVHGGEWTVKDLAQHLLGDERDIHALQITIHDPTINMVNGRDGVEGQDGISCPVD